MFFIGRMLLDRFRRGSKQVSEKDVFSAPGAAG